MQAPGRNVGRIGQHFRWKAVCVSLSVLILGSSGCEMLQEEPPSSLANGLMRTVTQRTQTGPGAVPKDEEQTGIVAEEQDSKPSGSRESYKVQKSLASPVAGLDTPAIPPPCEVRSIRLGDVLALAGMENPTILLAEQAVQSSLAVQLQARVLFLPDLNVGGGYYNHTGPLQTSSGSIRGVDRQDAYLGLGSQAVGAGTVAYPGVWLYAHLGNGYYEPKVASRVVAQRSFEAVATRNRVLLDVAVDYLRLLGAEGQLAIVRQTQADFADVVRLTQAYVDAGQGRPADALRAQTDASLVEFDERRVQEEVAVAAAELAKLLNLDPSIRLQIANDPILEWRLIDPKWTLPELLQVALRNRPEIQAVAAEIAAAQTRVMQEKTRPFLPTLSVGYSEGAFGGGSQFSAPGFSTLRGRADFDIGLWWTIQNLGFGNSALIKQRKAQMGEAQARQGLLVNQIDREVADAYNLSAARSREVQTALRQVQTAVDGFQQDMNRIRGFQGLPIELLNSADLLYQTRRELLTAIISFDEAQFQLFVALGQPPTRFGLD